jgi:glutathione S-transferase
MAIIEFLEDEYPGTRKLLPGDSFNKSMVRSLALNVSFWQHLSFQSTYKLLNMNF